MELNFMKIVGAASALFKDFVWLKETKYKQLFKG